jgi:anti-anti-sigma factor
MQLHGRDLAHVNVLPPAADDLPAVCEVSGEIDVSTVGRLTAGLTSALGLAPAAVADLSEVTFLASVGVRALCDATGDDPDQVLVLVTGRKVDRILRICGLESVLTCRPDRCAAMEACRAALRERRCA